MNTFKLAVVVTTAAISLVACSSATVRSTDSVPSVARCDQVSAVQVGAVLGFTVTATPRPKAPSNCNFFSDVVKVNHVPALVTLDRDPSDSDGTMWLRALYKDGAAVAGNRTVVVDGTSAMWIPFPAGTGGGGQLAAERSDEVLDVTVDAAASTDPESTAQSLMILMFNTQSK